MKLEVKIPMSETTITNSAGLVRKGKVEKPRVSAMTETSMICRPFLVMSRSPPQNGENMIVSAAGIRETSEIRV